MFLGFAIVCLKLGVLIMCAIDVSAFGTPCDCQPAAASARTHCKKNKGRRLSQNQLPELFAPPVVCDDGGVLIFGEQKT